MKFYLIIVSIFLKSLTAYGLDLGIVSVIDQQRLSASNNCVLVDRQICLMPIELICDETVVAEVNACSEGLNIFRKSEEVDTSYEAIHQFMTDQGFVLDQSYKYLLNPTTQIHFLTFNRKN